MSYTVKEIEDNIAYCGLICMLCNEKKSGNCKGCKGKCDDCSIKACAESKQVNGCWECDQYPCGQDMFKHKRSKAFLQCAREEGVHKLAEYLKKNDDEGIRYHTDDGTPGDYDVLDNAEQIMDLLRKQVKEN